VPVCAVSFVLELWITKVFYSLEMVSVCGLKFFFRAKGIQRNLATSQCAFIWTMQTV